MLQKCVKIVCTYGQYKKSFSDTKYYNQFFFIVYKIWILFLSKCNSQHWNLNNWTFPKMAMNGKHWLKQLLFFFVFLTFDIILIFVIYLHCIIFCPVCPVGKLFYIGSVRWKEVLFHHSLIKPDIFFASNLNTKEYSKTKLCQIF